MKKELYVFGSIEALIGIIILCTCSMAKEILPILGRVAFQSAAAGSYDPMNYEVGFGVAIGLSILLIIVGIAQIIYAFIKKNKEAK